MHPVRGRFFSLDLRGLRAVDANPVRLVYVHEQNAVMPSARDRLLLVFADLVSYGIAARPALPASRDEAHAALAGELLARHPFGMASYVFWTEHDDAVSGPTEHSRAT